MAFTVSATHGVGDSVGAGGSLQVAVFTGAAAVQPGATTTANTGTCAITPSASGSLVFGVESSGNNVVPIANAATTFLAGSPYLMDGSNRDAFNCVSAAATTSGTPVTLGPTNASFGVEYALAEILSSGGTVALDASSPALARSNTPTLPLVTASFTPPGGSVLVASVVWGSSSGTAPVITDTSGLGLTWAQQVAASNTFTGGHQWIYTAVVPGSGGTTASAGVAAATGSALSGLAVLGANAVTALATGLGFTPAVSLGAVVSAGLAAARGTALAPASPSGVAVVQGQSRATVGEAAGSSASVTSAYGSSATVGLPA